MTEKNLTITQKSSIEREKSVEVAAFFPLLRLLIKSEDFIDEVQIGRAHV